MDTYGASLSLTSVTREGGNAAGAPRQDPEEERVCMVFKDEVGANGGCR